MFDEFSLSEHVKHTECSMSLMLSNQLNKYIRIVLLKYIKILVIQSENNFLSFFFAFLLSTEVILALLIEKIYISNHIYLLNTHTFFVLTSLLVVDNMIQESDHSYSISVLL